MAKSVAALQAAGFRVIRVLTWSTSDRNLASITPTAACALGRGVAALSIPPCCAGDVSADALRLALSAVPVSAAAPPLDQSVAGRPSIPGSLYDAASRALRISVRGGHPRFAGPTWSYEGAAGACCSECGGELHVFRRPYDSAGRRYRYWGFVCPGCRRCFTLDEFDAASQKLLRSHVSP